MVSFNEAAKTKCEVCKCTVSTSSASRLSPRQMAHLKVRHGISEDTADIQVLWAFAVTMIVFNNPPDSADRQMWWICSKCLSNEFLSGCYQENIRACQQIEKELREYGQEEQEAQQQIDARKKTKFWQLWKKRGTPRAQKVLQVSELPLQGEGFRHVPDQIAAVYMMITSPSRQGEGTACAAGHKVPTFGCPECRKKAVGP